MTFKQHTPYAFYRPVKNIEFEVYTDGAYFKQHKLGGWGVAIYQNEKLVKTLNGVQMSQSSLEMELIAAISALTWFQKHHPKKTVGLFTDAQILLEGLFTKYAIWEKNNWKSKNGSKVGYQQLWQKLYELSFHRPVNFYWVKAHFENPGNQLADQLSREIILQTHN